MKTCTVLKFELERRKILPHLGVFCISVSLWSSLMQLFRLHQNFQVRSKFKQGVNPKPSLGISIFSQCLHPFPSDASIPWVQKISAVGGGHITFTRWNFIFVNVILHWLFLATIKKANLSPWTGESYHMSKGFLVLYFLLCCIPATYLFQLHFLDVNEIIVSYSIP